VEVWIELARPLFKNVLRRSASGGRICAALTLRRWTQFRAVGPTQFTPLHRHDNSTLGNRVWATFAFFLTPISTLWVKKQDIVVLSVTWRNVYRFLKFFHCLRLKSKFAIKSYLNIPPRLDRVATLPGEISMFKKSPCLRNKCSEIPWKT